ncbi:MAG: cobyrinate a,c-diamide synthase, partial [Gammaproteobacteria bacterium]|nr:cobyrinate a,c-diamide synthase [Gammaproteobacteria bacterium]
MAHFYISAAHKSSGKTTMSIGLCAALSKKGYLVQPFKKGPDYIDPIWLSQATGRPCHNLDFNTQSHEEILYTYSHYSQAADICLIEGNKGLFDGMDLHGSDSNAAMAKLLEAPVVMVLDTRGSIRGVAPLLLGYQGFDTEINIAGVILNQVGGGRHEGKLRAVLEEYTDIPVLGAVHRHPAMNIDERHLGLMPGNEDKQAHKKIAELGRLIDEQVDLEALMSVASSAPEIVSTHQPAIIHRGDPVRIAIARDASFGFYYPGDLEAMQQAGAELVELDTLHDTVLPEVDGLFIGGGFPEMQMVELEANIGLRTSIHESIEAGLPAYAECGGLMYLSRAIVWQGKRHEMVGLIPADAVMYDRPQGR